MCIWIENLYLNLNLEKQCIWIWIGIMVFVLDPKRCVGPNPEYNIVTLFVMYILYVYSMYMYFVSRNSNISKVMTLGGNQLQFATSRK